MILSDLYNQLARGELRELAIGGATIGGQTNGILPADYPRLLPHIQMGLTSLYTRCSLKEGTVVVPLALPRASYILAVDHDVPLNWADDLLMIERVEGVYLGEAVELPLDDLEDPGSIRKPAANMLMVPTDVVVAPWLKETTDLVVRYRANHPAIDPYLANAAPIAVEIELPMTHVEALCLFVASRLINPLGMTPGSMHEGNNYAMKYEAAVAALNDLGMHQRAHSQNTRLVRNGWV